MNNTWQRWARTFHSFLSMHTAYWAIVHVAFCFILECKENYSIHWLVWARHWHLFVLFVWHFPVPLLRRGTVSPRKLGRARDCCANWPRLCEEWRAQGLHCRHARRKSIAQSPAVKLISTVSNSLIVPYTMHMSTLTSEGHKVENWELTSSHK